MGPYPLQIQPPLDGLAGFSLLHFASLEPMDHWLPDIHMGVEVEVGERTSQNLGKNFFDPNPGQD